LNISCNLLHIVLKVKNRLVAWVQNGYKCMDCLSLWLPGLLWAAVQCLLPSVVSIISQITSLGEGQNSKYSFYCVSLSHHHKIEKLLSRAIISQGSSVFHFFTLKSETSTKSTNPTNLYSAAVTCRTLYQRRASEWFSLIHRNLCPPRLCNLARRGWNEDKYLKSREP